MSGLHGVVLIEWLDDVVMINCTLIYLVLHFLYSRNLKCCALSCQSQLGCFSPLLVKNM